MTKDKDNKKIEEIKKELELHKQRCEENLDGWKRAKADYINFKKDSEKRFGEFAKFANAALIVEILPILDNFKESEKHLPKDLENNDWAKGVLHIKKQIEDILRSLGIEAIKTVGEKFNPEFHEAVESVEKKDEKSHQIIEEVRPGYKMHDKVIQVAKVKVAK
ncbi:nucleotide exchange factor GrpE [Patescibacteria group bacterium]|nr:nucleotide exchange factor GrpE [Patescibacteria group bacterium]